MLFRKFPDYLEGDLTRIKSIVVSRRTCAKISEELGIDEFLMIGKGMGSHDQTPSSVMADVFESLIGAIYLDGGMEAARTFIVRHIGPEIDAAVEGQGGVNHKSNLQQVAQREFGETPSYLLLDEKGPDHSKCFKIAARIGDAVLCPGLGPQQEGRRAARGPQRAVPARGRTPPLRVGLTGRGCRGRVVGFRSWARLGGLALPVATGLRHALLQVQPVLERAQPRPAAALRAGAGDDADPGPAGRTSRGRPTSGCSSGRARGWFAACSTWA